MPAVRGVGGGRRCRIWSSDAFPAARATWAAHRLQLSAGDSRGHPKPLQEQPARPLGSDVIPVTETHREQVRRAGSARDGMFLLLGHLSALRLTSLTQPGATVHVLPDAGIEAPEPYFTLLFFPL